eukprot:11199592-Lingulodinium_polyedra.AAC.1
MTYARRELPDDLCFKPQLFAFHLLDVLCGVYVGAALAERGERLSVRKLRRNRLPPCPRERNLTSAA